MPRVLDSLDAAAHEARVPIAVATILDQEDVVRAVCAGATAYCLVGQPRTGATWHLSLLRNVGARWAAVHGATHVVFHDADILVAPWYIEQLLEQIEACPQDVVVPMIHRDGISRAASGLAVYPLEPLVRERGFDEEYTAWGQEDLDLIRRLERRQGLRCHVMSELALGLEHIDHLDEHRHDVGAHRSLERLQSLDARMDVAVNPDGWGREAI